ncbi:MAG TPA: multidrug ABC transporter ATP-binding protein [Bradyrhizobium sp.]|nr:multidrug ABC transporter ATP-binding protein [Bradyrhizobium sp.]
MTDKFISIEGIARRYPGAGGGTTTVFENFWLSMARGEFGCVIGHSGCGKTTVLNILAGLDQPSEGTVIVDGQGIEGTSLDRAVIFQSHALLPWRTVLGNVGYAVSSKWRKWDRARVKAHAQRFIDLVGLTGSEHKHPSELSGGMKRRVMIAKALSHEPQILFLDEPTAGVDVELRKGMWEVVRTLQASGVTIILTTHYIEEAEEMADRIGVINKGEIILIEDKATLMQKLGKKELTLQLQNKLDAIPPALAAYNLELSDDGHAVTYDYDTKGDRTGITSLLNDLRNAGIRISDLDTRQSSLEDIFVSIVRAP